MLLGASGMLGSSLVPSLQASGHTVFRQSRFDGLDIKLDLTSCQEWIECLAYINPEVIINLAAATNVDQCESNPQWAFQGNLAPLLAFCRASHVSNSKPHFVQVSTDQVYDGPGLHFEDKVSPVNVYSITKLSAELSIENYPSTIIRTNFFGKSHALKKPSFSDWIIDSLVSQRHVTLFDDVFFSPVHMSSLCEVVKKVISEKHLGVFNVGCSSGISKAQFGMDLAARLGLSTSNINIGSVADFKLIARRPLDMRMSISKFEDKFNMSLPTFKVELDKVVSEYHA